MAARCGRKMVKYHWKIVAVPAVWYIQNITTPAPKRDKRLTKQGFDQQQHGLFRRGAMYIFQEREL